MRGLSRGLTAAVATIAVALAAAPASAGVPGYPTAMTSMSVNDDSQATEDALCDTGDMAISGGTYNAATIQQQVWLKSSRPGAVGDPADPEAWTVEVQNVFGGGMSAAPAEVWAICDEDGAGEYKVRKKTDVPVPNEKQVTKLTRCKDGEAVVGGGADVGGTIAERVQLSSSAPLDDGDRDRLPDGWYVAAEGAGEDSAATTMDVYAVCDQERKPKKYRYTKSTEPVEDGTQGEATAVCDVVEPRVGGGILSQSKFAHALRINTTYPAGGTGWDTFVDNVDTPDDKTRKVTATAICLK